MSMGVSPPPSHGTCSGLPRHHDPGRGGPGGRGPGAFLPWRGPRGGGLGKLAPLPHDALSPWGPAGLAGAWGGEAGLAGTSPLVGGRGHSRRHGRAAAPRAGGR